jgi:hypothetical protein
MRLCGGTEISCLHSLQIFLASLWATMQLHDEATRNGSIPMFRSLVMVLGASFV